MGDPLSISASAIALLTAGITVTTSLVEFYTSFKNQDSQVDSMTEKLRDLLSIYEFLTNTFSSRGFRADEQSLIGVIEKSIQKCDTLFAELQNECEKLNSANFSGIRAAVKVKGRRALYPFRKSTLERLDEDICEIRGNLAFALGALGAQDNQRIVHEIDEMKQDVSSIRTHQISKELHDWLKPSNVIETHRLACEKRYPGTGTWLVKDANYITWLLEANSFVWLNGFAGTGKSILCSVVIEDISRYRKSDSSIGFAFFYFAFNDESKQNESVMLRTLIWQLSSQVENGNEELGRLFRFHKTGFPASTVMTDHLRRLIQKFRHVYLILDGLDESPQNGARERVLETLEIMRKWSLEGLHLFVTSQDEVDIRASFRFSLDTCINQIMMKNMQIDQDIADFITGRLHDDRRLLKWSSSRGIIQRKLVKRAQGIFRWADCQMRDLARCPRSDDHLERMLSSLPRSLEETYQRILCNIDISSIEDAKRILTLLCFASRPLTVKELIDGIAVETTLLRLNVRRRFHNASDIQEICSSLIEVDLDTNDMTKISGEDIIKGYVRLAHSSVEEYLTSESVLRGDAAKLSINKGSAHAEIALICLIYLLEPGLSRTSSVEDVLENYPLAPFAAKYWHYHYKRAEHQISKLDGLILELFQNRCSFISWIQLHDPDDSRSQHNFLLSSDHIAGPIYYASLLGLGQILRQLIDIQQQQNVTADSIPLAVASKIQGVNVLEGEQGSALQAASSMGHEDIVRLLLEKGASVNTRGGKYGNALQTASYMGHETIVRILIKNGADVNAQCGKYGNALQAACYEGHETIIRLLIDHRADVNAQGGFFGTALQAASAEGHIKIVRLLIENLANVNAQGGYFGTALEAAYAEGHEMVVKFLTEMSAAFKTNPGANSRVTVSSVAPTQSDRELERLLTTYQGKWVRSDVEILPNAEARRIYHMALTAAAEKGHEKIIRLLIKKMTNANAQGKYDEVMLTALSKGHEKIVRLLLEKGANVNAREESYSSILQKTQFTTALTVASIHGHESIVQLLIEKGVNADAGALISASQNGHEGIVRLLLEKGWSPDAQDEEHYSALGAASGSGHERIVQLLVEEGANVNALEKDGTALQLASASGHETIVQLLLEKSADINALGGKNACYGTALQTAAKLGRENVVRLLLDKGADLSIEDRQKGLGTALQEAVIGDNEEIVRLLMERDAGAQGKYGTELQLAASRGNENIVRLLLDKGADVNVEGGRFKDYRTALQEASKHGHEKVVRLLLERNADAEEKYEKALRLALMQGHENIVRLLLEKGADFTAQEGFSSELVEASKSGYKRIVTLLLGKDSDLKIDEATLKAALKEASTNGHYGVVKILVEKGADVVALDEYYETALQEASRLGHESVVQRLLEKEVVDNFLGFSDGWEIESERMSYFIK